MIDNVDDMMNNLHMKMRDPNKEVTAAELAFALGFVYGEYTALKAKMEHQ